MICFLCKTLTVEDILVRMPFNMLSNYHTQQQTYKISSFFFTEQELLITLTNLWQKSIHCKTGAKSHFKEAYLPFYFFHTPMLTKNKQLFIILPNFQKGYLDSVFYSPHYISCYVHLCLCVSPFPLQGVSKREVTQHKPLIILLKYYFRALFHNLV